MKGSNSSYPLVEEYFSKKLLVDLGYRFDPEDLEDWKVEAFTVIRNRILELDELDRKRNSKKR